MIHIAGIGNEFRRDDGAGPFVLSLIKGRLGEHPDGITFHLFSDSLLNILEEWSESDVVILIDAVSHAPKKRPGEICRLNLLKELPRTTGLRFSSHAFDPVQLVQMAVELGQTPKSLILYGIEARKFSYGRGLSLAVERAAHDVADMIVGEVG